MYINYKGEKMSKITVSQRKYFVTRIEGSINDKIALLKQSNAADVQAISEKAYNKYLKHIGVAEDIKEYNKINSRAQIVGQRIRMIFEEVKKSVKDPNDNKYDHTEPSLYMSMNREDIAKGFQWCCNKTAQKQETETDAGKMIAELEDKKRAAIDQLHGINELQELTTTVNTILNGAGVPLLGE